MRNRKIRIRVLDPLEHLELRLYDPDLKIKMHDEDLVNRETVQFLCRPLSM